MTQSDDDREPKTGFSTFAMFPRKNQPTDPSVLVEEVFSSPDAHVAQTPAFGRSVAGPDEPSTLVGCLNGTQEETFHSGDEVGTEVPSKIQTSSRII